MATGLRMWTAVLRTFGLEPLPAGIAQKLVDDLDAVRLEKEKLETRVRGLQQGIYAANETARRWARTARRVATVPDEPCPFEAVVKAGIVSCTLPCVRTGVHDEHRFEQVATADDVHVLVSLEPR